jgi:hypothetical protein
MRQKSNGSQISRLFFCISAYFFFFDIQMQIASRFYLNFYAWFYFKRLFLRFSCRHFQKNKIKGFECRGTVLSRRAVAWENLLRASQRAGPLSTNPLESTAGTSTSSLKSNDAPRKKK